MIRPTSAFLGAALAAVSLGLGVSYAACPVRDVGLSISKPPSAQPETNTAQSELHRVREYPNRQGHLVSPFLPEHPTREQSRASATPKAAPKPENVRRTPPEKEKEIRLVGVVSSEVGRRAILSVDKQQILLAPGEEKEGVTLVSLSEKEVIVSTPTGERRLSLSLGI